MGKGENTFRNILCNFKDRFHRLQAHMIFYTDRFRILSIRKKKDFVIN